MAATRGVVLMGEGESRTAMRRREVWRRWLQWGRAGRKSGLGKVKVMYREGTTVWKVVGSSTDIFDAEKLPRL